MPAARDARRADPCPSGGAAPRADGADGRAGEPRAADVRARSGSAICSTSRTSCSASARRSRTTGSCCAAISARSSARRAIATLTPRDVDAYIAAKRREGLAVKTITNHLNFAHGVFAFAVKRGLGDAQPRRDDVDRPPSPPSDPDIRFLDREELEALLRAAADDLLGPTDRVLWLTAAMTGLRQGELAALRWRDVDWSAGLIRVRRSYSRGQYTTPKSRRSSRAVPMADRVAARARASLPALRVPHDDELVFCHPHIGPAVRRQQESRAVQARARSARACDRCASTTCATPTARSWPRPARRCGRSRAGWATATTRRPRSTPTSRPTRRKARCGRSARSARNRLTRQPRQIQVPSPDGSTNPSVGAVPTVLPALALRAVRPRRGLALQGRRRRRERSRLCA